MEIRKKNSIIVFVFNLFPGHADGYPKSAERKRNTCFIIDLPVEKSC